jgi:hypothetical protein
MAEGGSGVIYCGKKSSSTRTKKKIITVQQKAFAEGTLEVVPVDRERNLNPAPLVGETGRSDFRSTLRSLQWLATPSWARYMFYRNHLQKRVNKVNVTGLLVANKVVKIIKSQQVVLKCRDLCNNDPGLYDGVDVEIEK